MKSKQTVADLWKSRKRPRERMTASQSIWSQAFGQRQRRRPMSFQSSGGLVSQSLPEASRDGSRRNGSSLRYPSRSTNPVLNEQASDGA